MKTAEPENRVLRFWFSNGKQKRNQPLVLVNGQPAALPESGQAPEPDLTAPGDTAAAAAGAAASHFAFAAASQVAALFSLQQAALSAQDDLPLTAPGAALVLWLLEQAASARTRTLAAVIVKRFIVVFSCKRLDEEDASRTNLSIHRSNA